MKERKKHIAIIENHIISTNTVRRKLVEVFMEKGYSVTILSTGSPEELSLAKSYGFNVVNVGTSDTSPLSVGKYIRKLRKAARECKADVLLTYTMRPAIWGNIVARSLKLPIITNITGTGPLGDSKHIAYRVARLLYSGVLRKTNAVFFQNEDDREIFLNKNFVTEDRTRVIPGSGVDVDFFSPLPKAPQERFQFLFISRLIRDKGILEFVEAARMLKKEGLKVDFNVLGPLYHLNLKGNMITNQDLQSWIEEDLIVYHGANYDVRQYIADADCVVLPSYREGMSNVLLEAGSMERPAITCNVTGCKDIIVDGVTGYLCEVKNGVDLADKMFRMIRLSDEQRTAMGKAARKRMLEVFNKEIVIKNYLEVVESLTKN